MSVNNDGSWTYSNTQSNVWEVKVISYNPDRQTGQQVLCGQNYGKPCTAGSWTTPKAYGSTGCMMIQIDYDGGGCNAKDPVFCFKE